MFFAEYTSVVTNSTSATTERFSLNDFASRVRIAIESRKWTLERLAQETGLSKTYLWEIKGGTKNVSVETLARLCRAFELRADYLLFGE